jgi:HPt (histidine-containing phosphotransfer) domain-containing protein
MSMTPSSRGNTSCRVTVSIDPDLEELVPGFLENRRKDVATLARAVQTQDVKTVRLLGHRMKGDGGGYGFQEISQIGEALEQAAIREHWTVIAEKTEALRTFLAQVDVVYRK